MYKDIPLKRKKNIVSVFALLILSGSVLPLSASTRKGMEKQPAQSDVCFDSLPIERQQQFLYYFYEAERLLQARQLELAWEVIQFCQELHPDDAMVNYYLGCFLQTQYGEQAAQPYWKRAFELDPDENWYHYTQALLQQEQQESYRQAVSVLEGVAQRNPANAEVREQLQKAYILAGDYRKALVLQDKIDTLNGYDAQSAIQRYRLNMLLHRTRQAIREVERYLEVEPDNYQFQVFRMQLYELTRQPSAKMIAAYRALLRLNPDNLAWMNNLAWHLCLSGEDLQYAEELSRITILRESSNATYLDTYAWILYQQGEYDTALFYIQRAIEKADASALAEIQSHYKAIQRKAKTSKKRSAR